MSKEGDSDDDDREMKELENIAGREIKDREEEGLTEDFKIEEINKELIELGIRKDSDKQVKVFFVNNKVGNSYKSEDNKKKIEVFELE